MKNSNKKLNIVLLGNFNVDFTSETHYLKTLDSMGHNVYPLQEGLIPSSQILEEALKSDIFFWVHTHGWDTPGEISMMNVLKKLEEKSVPSVAYHLDLYMPLGRWKEYNKDNPYMNVEYFFTVDKLMADWFNNNTDVKGYYLPAGVFKEECYISKKQKVMYEIVFTGNKDYHEEYPFRRELIEFLQKEFKNRFVHIGGGSEYGIKRGDELNQIYSNAKIAIGDTLSIDFNYPHYFSDRLFEQPGRGAFQIFPDIKGVEDMYIPGKEIVLYKNGNLDDLKKKIDYYLENDKEREDIRINGHNKTIQYHTYENRMQSIIDTVIK